MRCSLRAAGTVVLATTVLAVPSTAGAQTETTPTTPAPDAPRIVKGGVTVNGVAVQGMTREQVVQALTPLARQKPKGGSITVRIAGRPHTISSSRIGWRWDVDAAADAAIRARVRTPLTIPVGWDAEAVDTWIASLSKMGRKARDGRVVIRIKRHALRSARSGWKVERAKLRKTVADAIKVASTGEDQEVVQKVRRVKPKVTANGLRRQYGTVVTVDRKTFQLRLFKRLKWVKTYKIAVGAAGHDTPAGFYSVTSRQINPAWHVPNSAWAGSLAGQVIPGGAPNNPLKARWLGLRDGIGIHGTAETWSLGSRASHGCIRMHPNDVVELYRRVPMGTTVRVR
ncbi:MAG: L,D-transpeptidase [Solirubrobacteraceae bacterium]|nr:L,D-transpeptidase [Solirubrobacteraceae bacterium]